MWKVPISIVLSSTYPKIHQEILLEKQSDEVNLGVLDENEIIKLNKHSVGMYRTNYSPDMLQKLSELVKTQKLHPTDRLGLQNDVFALSKAGKLGASDVLKFIEGYSNEDNVTVWKDLLTNLQSLSHLLLNTNYHNDLQSFVRRLLKPAAKRLGWDALEGESSLQAMCRATVLRNLALNGDADVIAESKKRFEAHLNGQLIPADIRSAVYSAALYDADAELLGKFIDLHNKSDLQEEKMRIANSLGSVRTEELINRVLEFAISESVRSQDSVSVICAVSGNTSTKLSADLAWDFIKKNWKAIHSRYASGFLITRLIKSSTENFATQEDYEDIEVSTFI